MKLTDLIIYFLGGACLTNAIPHLVSGLTGRTFPSVFSKPIGVGHSSSMVNFLWGWANIAFAYLLLFKLRDFDIRSTSATSAALLGALAIGISLALHFGKLHGKRRHSL
ncbi:hypothetical protein SAMN05443245_7259 [Paraburkholderia fungorum]|uniref:Uncharacterized protein n=1 Tax=Paraburkholderia fungorum TaxID=134537 RepID=A0A1H1JVW4_9BURK|nr:hypothetical protein [Paraburkholderia fungorum]SDR53765.1 hypothetical protein SAMN05443245_7259 [Paraburkholderia fungorum]